MKEKLHFETLAVRNQIEQSPHREHSTSIYMTSSFIFESAEQARATFANEVPGNIYSRFSNPNNDEFIAKLATMEGTEDGIATSSGMAAMFAAIATFLSQGDHLVASRALFGSTHQIITQILPRWGISHTYVDGTEYENWEKAIRENTKMIFLETPGNPGLGIVDLEMAGDLARKRNILFCVDNCFATPYLQKPARYGADLVCHSATKFLDGQGRVIAGAILGTRDTIEKVRFFTRHTGPSLSPFHGWILSQSLETLAVRMDRHCDNALQLARYLEGHKKIKWVRYPFLSSHPQYGIARKQMSQGGALVSFEVAGGFSQGRDLLDHVQLMSLTANLGDARTTITHPASTTHSKLTEEERMAVGITDGLIRVSVGLEHIQDIIDDLDKALSR
jgi:O-succinylhomoserine sulfhydrylase